MVFDCIGGFRCIFAVLIRIQYIHINNRINMKHLKRCIDALAQRIAPIICVSQFFNRFRKRLYQHRTVYVFLWIFSQINRRCPHHHLNAITGRKRALIGCLFFFYFNSMFIHAVPPLSALPCGITHLIRRLWLSAASSFPPTQPPALKVLSETGKFPKESQTWGDFPLLTLSPSG